MATKAQIQKQNDGIARARERMLVMLKAHDGFFPCTSECLSCLGVLRTYACLARDQLLADGTMRQGREQVTLGGRQVSFGFYELVDQQPGPITRSATIRSHLYSQTKNKNLKDSHPWRRETLACVACARVRDAFPDWGVTAEGGSKDYTPTHPPGVGDGQIPLGRKARRKK